MMHLAITSLYSVHCQNALLVLLVQAAASDPPMVVSGWNVLVQSWTFGVSFILRFRSLPFIVMLRKLWSRDCDAFSSQEEAAEIVNYGTFLRTWNSKCNEYASACNMQAAVIRLASAHSRLVIEESGRVNTKSEATFSDIDLIQSFNCCVSSLGLVGRVQFMCFVLGVPWCQWESLDLSFTVNFFQVTKQKSREEDASVVCKSAFMRPCIWMQHPGSASNQANMFVFLCANFTRQPTATSSVVFWICNHTGTRLWLYTICICFVLSIPFLGICDSSRYRASFTINYRALFPDEVLCGYISSWKGWIFHLQRLAYRGSRERWRTVNGRCRFFFCCDNSRLLLPGTQLSSRCAWGECLSLERLSNTFPQITVLAIWHFAFRRCEGFLICKSKTSQTSPKAKLHRLKVVWVVWKYSTRVFKNEHYSSSLQCFMSTRHVEVLRAALANHVRVTLSLVFRFFCVSRVLWDKSHWF